jgi:hypothetical protein
VTYHPWTIETVLDRQIQVDTSIEIIAKKIRYRGAAFTSRDIFDLAMVAEKQPEEIARIKPILREQRDAVLARLASDERILRKTFGELDVLDYRRSYDECLALVTEVFKAQ